MVRISCGLQALTAICFSFAYGMPQQPSRDLARRDWSDWQGHPNYVDHSEEGDEIVHASSNGGNEIAPSGYGHDGSDQPAKNNPWDYAQDLEEIAELLQDSGGAWASDSDAIIQALASFMRDATQDPSLYGSIRSIDNLPVEIDLADLGILDAACEADTLCQVYKSNDTENLQKRVGPICITGMSILGTSTTLTGGSIALAPSAVLTPVALVGFFTGVIGMAIGGGVALIGCIGGE